MNRRLRNHPLKTRRIGVEESLWEDVYHRLLRLTWPRFFLLFLLVYIAINILFAELYWMFPGAIANIKENDLFSYFSFSVETLATIGYGYFYPATPVAHVLVTIESAIGLFFTAGLTGLIFAKFGKASARIVFSENILWTTQNGKPMLCLRLGNVRTNRVFDGKATLTLLRDETSTEGETIRRLVSLKLQRNETPLFALSWTIFHPLDDDSPLKNTTPEEMLQKGWEIYVTFTGIDQDMAQTIVEHSTYTADRIIRARKFVDMITIVDGVRQIDFSKLHGVDR